MTLYVVEKIPNFIFHRSKFLSHPKIISFLNKRYMHYTRNIDSTENFASVMKFEYLTPGKFEITNIDIILEEDYRFSGRPYDLAVALFQKQTIAHNYLTARRFLYVWTISALPRS